MEYSQRRPPRATIKMATRTNARIFQILKRSRGVETGVVVDAMVGS
jgi:hypothetical protein